jgi:queuine tRNA-ribosyltransferase
MHNLRKPEAVFYLIIPPMFEYELVATQRNARVGVFHTPHGDLLTPVFAPVGTQATVKTLTPGQLRDLGATLVLSNTYHLYLRPGDELVAEMGGLHQFMQWPNPVLTDSGGYQVFSLSETRKIDDDGVTFKSHIDGSTHRFTPERSIQIQNNLGADIIMAFDECSDPNDHVYSSIAMDRTHRWAERSLKAHRRADQALFGIVQGGVNPHLRSQSAEFIASLPFPGIAIGGLSVGETKAEMMATLDVVVPRLPDTKPRYLMGVGTPEDLILGIAHGIDIFDCVLPTRLARHHAAFSSEGRLNLMNAVYAHDPNPIDESCQCYTCRTFSRAYIRHLINAKELLAGTLLSIHNLHTMIQLVQDIRETIINGTFENKVAGWLTHWQGNAERNTLVKDQGKSK